MIDVFFVYLPEMIKPSMHKTSKSLLGFDTQNLFWSMIAAQQF